MANRKSELENILNDINDGTNSTKHSLNGNGTNGTKQSLNGSAIMEKLLLPSYLCSSHDRWVCVEFIGHNL